MPRKTKSKLLTDLSQQVVRTVLYFDIFDHPITLDEVVYFAADSSDDKYIQEELDRHVKDGSLYFNNGYYSPSENLDELISKRLAGEKIARSVQDKAYSRAKFIGKFPYVKAAYISGSMSKGIMHADGDVDFFIITEPGRLWVARTLLILYKKLFLFNSHKFFCVNYFIDSGNLEIEEKNLFTATEAATLKPVYDSGIYKDFYNANSWVKEYLPNQSEQKVIFNGNTRRPMAKAIERMLDNSFGDRLDRLFMSSTLKFWKMRFKDFEPSNFDLALKTRTYVSKHHPRNFQSRVLTALNERVKRFEAKHNTRRH